MLGNLGHNCANPYNLEEVVVISLKGSYTATALHIRPSPGVFKKVHHKNVDNPINKRRLY